MYKARLSQWGISKNYSDKDYQICAALHHYRENIGKRSTAFVIHGHKRSLRDLHKYIKGRKMTEDEFLAVALSNVDVNSMNESDRQQQQYAHVRAYTPEPETEGDEAPLPQPPKPASSMSPQPATVRGEASLFSTSGSVAAQPVSMVSVLPGTGLSGSQRGSPTSHRQLSPLTQDLPTIPLKLATQSIPSKRQTPGGQFPTAPEESHSFLNWNSPQASSSASHAHLLSSPVDVGSSSAYSSSSQQASSNVLQGPFEDPVQHARSVHSRSSPAMSCQQLGRDVEYMALQMVDAPHLKSLCGSDDIQAWRLLSDTSSIESQDFEHVCPTCHDLTKDHFVSLPNLEIARQPHQTRSILNDNTCDTTAAVTGTISVPVSSREHEHSWKWVARCFAACIYLSRGNDTLSQMSLRDAEEEFERMLVPEQDPKALLALNHTLSILQMHNQGQITREIMAAANRVAERVLGPEEPLTVISRWMVYVSNAQMQRCDITSAMLFDVHEEFTRRHGPDDLRAIASLYCYGYMLNVERQLEQAEQVLREVCARSTTILGPAHLQSISALTNLHRSLERQDRVDEAIDVLHQAIRDSRDTLGKSHPRRLETMRLLGVLYERKGRLDLAEKWFWPVIEGRVKMLGRNHAYSQGMKRDMENLLTRMGKWWVERPQVPSQENQGPSPTAMSSVIDKKARKESEPQTKEEKAPEQETIASREQLRIQDLFEWDPDDMWDDGNSVDGSETGSQTEAF